MRLASLSLPLSLPLPLFFLQISSSTEFRLCVEVVARTLPRRFVSTFRSNFSLAVARWISGKRRGEGYTRAIPTPCTPSKILRWSRSIIVGESRRLRNDFIGSLTGSLLSRFPWHTVMKIYRRLYRGWDHRERRRMAYCRFAMGKVFKV